MKMIMNGIPCEVDLSCTSSAGSYIFASFEDFMRAHNSDEKCEFCQKTFRPVVKETVNGKVACPDCREQLIPPMVVFFDRHRQVHYNLGSGLSYGEFQARVLQMRGGKP